MAKGNRSPATLNPTVGKAADNTKVRRQQALLKTGAGARAEVEKALKAQQDAQDKLNISKAAYDLGKETEDLLAAFDRRRQHATVGVGRQIRLAVSAQRAGQPQRNRHFQTLDGFGLNAGGWLLLRGGRSPVGRTLATKKRRGRGYG